MNRIGVRLEDVSDFGNLYRAYLRARRGKRHRSSVEGFTVELERELLKLQRELLDGSYRPGGFREFEIRDPKPRRICVAPFRDRVLHQAIIGLVEPELDRRLDFDSYACRQGKGVDAALRRAIELSRRSAWVLRGDIAKCFESIPHAPLVARLHRLFKDRALLELLEKIVSCGGEAGRGLPIGNLTSQWYANVYLGEIDRFARQVLRCRGYLRYMDDFCVFTDDRSRARAYRDALCSWLPEELGLQGNERASGIFPTTAWPFLGFRVGPHGLRLRRRTWRRFKKGIGALVHEHRRGRLGEEELAARAASRIAHIARARSRGLRRAAD